MWMLEQRFDLFIDYSVVMSRANERVEIPYLSGWFGTRSLKPKGVKALKIESSLTWVVVLNNWQQ